MGTAIELGDQGNLKLSMESWVIDGESHALVWTLALMYINQQWKLALVEYSGLKTWWLHTYLRKVEMADAQMHQQRPEKQQGGWRTQRTQGSRSRMHLKVTVIIVARRKSWRGSYLPKLRCHSNNLSWEYSMALMFPSQKISRDLFISSSSMQQSLPTCLWWVDDDGLMTQKLTSSSIFFELLQVMSYPPILKYLAAFWWYKL